MATNKRAQSHTSTSIGWQRQRDGQPPQATLEAYVDYACEATDLSIRTADAYNGGGQISYAPLGGRQADVLINGQWYAIVQGNANQGIYLSYYTEAPGQPHQRIDVTDSDHVVKLPAYGWKKDPEAYGYKQLCSEIQSHDHAPCYETMLRQKLEPGPGLQGEVSLFKTPLPDDTWQMLVAQARTAFAEGKETQETAFPKYLDQQVQAYVKALPRAEQNLLLRHAPFGPGNTRKFNAAAKAAADIFIPNRLAYDYFADDLLAETAIAQAEHAARGKGVLFDPGLRHTRDEASLLPQTPSALQPLDVHEVLPLPATLPKAPKSAGRGGHP